MRLEVQRRRDKWRAYIMRLFQHKPAKAMKAIVNSYKEGNAFVTPQSIWHEGQLLTDPTEIVSAVESQQRQALSRDPAIDPLA
eukprot:scaffold240478_cov52-Prasinocladus_malaysianus.AAC.1